MAIKIEHTVLNALYHWSQKLSHKFHGLSSKVHYFEHFVDYEKILDKNMLVIISEHLLHPLQLCITHWPKTGKLCPYYGSVSAWVDFNVISGFVGEMLPKIVKALHTFPNIHFIFLAAAYRMYPHNATESGNLRFEPIGVSMMDEYNSQLSKIILKTAVEEKMVDRLQWMEVAKTIALGPVENIPLVADGVHLNHRNQESGLVDTHRSIIDVILNVYCRDKTKLVEKNACCGVD